MKLLYYMYVTLAAAVSALELSDDWNVWKDHYGKSYSSEVEELRRYLIWLNNQKYVDQHNSQNFTYTLIMNEFGDLENSEFNAIYNGDVYNGLSGTPDLKEMNEHTVLPKDVPSEVDWRRNGYVTPVKNQGACGSCWAFGATGALEGQLFKATGKLVTLSEQNLVDCSGSGCKGGTCDVAYKYVKQYGIDTEASYPYVAEQGNCSYNASNVGFNISTYVDVALKGNETNLKIQTATIGPLYVSINATQIQLYNGGVFNPTNCTKATNHAVLVVGYGHDLATGLDYWIVKNSWGTRWGVRGYIYVVRNKGNKCGIANHACYPVSASAPRLSTV